MRKVLPLILALLIYLVMSVPIMGQEPPVSIDPLKEAVEQGDAEAQFALGLMYKHGFGVLQDDDEAVKWFHKAAEQGDVNAQCMLGSIYGEGKGISQDYVQAHMWLNLCAFAAKGKEQDTGAKIRDEIAKNMTPQQIDEAQQLASEWKPVTPVHKSFPKQIGVNVLKSRLIKRVEPKYPEAAKRQRISGMVILVVTVDEGGNVTNIRATRGHDLLIDAAVEAVKQWKYSPTLLEGEPIPVTATVTVNFVVGGR